MGLKSIVKSAKGKVQDIVIGKLLATLLAKAADGSFGAPVKAAYWFLVGKKTLIAAILGAIAAGLTYLEPTFPWAAIAAHYVGIIAAGLAVLGQVDGGLRTEPPTK